MKAMSREEAKHTIYQCLGFCGCGSPDIVIKWIHEALTKIENRRAEISRNHKEGFEDESASAAVLEHFRINPETYQGDHLFEQMAWYFIDRGGLIEHGSSIRYSWLTEKGERFLAFLDESDDCGV